MTIPARSCPHGASDTVDLLLEIARCPEVAEARGDGGHPCHDIVHAQDGISAPGRWQLPTPWVGHLHLAKVLFLGSNPNIGGDEHYPTEDWSDEDVVDFFDAAFDGATGQIEGGIRALQADGRYGNWVRTWAAARKRAEELLGRPAEPGVDYAMTEIVHCRSRSERGVASARDQCADRYLDRILDQSGARVVVAFGAHNQDWLSRRYDVGDGLVHRLGDRWLVFLPHPTGRAKAKTFAGVLGESELEALRGAVG